MRKTNTLIFCLQHSSRVLKAGPRSSGTPFLVFNKNEKSLELLNYDVGEAWLFNYHYVLRAEVLHT